MDIPDSKARFVDLHFFCNTLRVELNVDESGENDPPLWIF